MEAPEEERQEEVSTDTNTTDPEIKALGLAIDAFLMVDVKTAERMLAYLRQRFVTDAAKQDAGRAHD
jgi:hypothetical protein